MAFKIGFTVDHDEKPAEDTYEAKYTLPPQAEVPRKWWYRCILQDTI